MADETRADADVIEFRWQGDCREIAEEAERVREGLLVAQSALARALVTGVADPGEGPPEDLPYFGRFDWEPHGKWAMYKVQRALAGLEEIMQVIGQRDNGSANGSRRPQVAGRPFASPA